MAGGAFTSLMATAEQSQSETALKKARLKALQESAESRTKQAELEAKEREKQDRWNKVLENHEKDVHKSTVKEVKAAPPPAKPKILQQGRSMTFKKLLKEAAKIDTSTFKVGPKVKVQTTNKSIDNPTKSARFKPNYNGILGRGEILSQKTADKQTHVERERLAAGGSAKLERSSALERSSSNTSRSVSPQKFIQPRSQPSSSSKTAEMGMSSNLRRVSPSRLSSNSGKTAKSTSFKSSITKSTTTTKPVSSVSSFAGKPKDAKSRLRESFVPNELIPLAQGPRRDLRSIEEIQNDLWRKKGKNYPSITGITKGPPSRPSSSSPSPAKLPSAIKPTPFNPGTGVTTSKPASTKTQQPPRKRVRDSSPSEDSFIASEDDEISPEKFDYRAEIRAMFKRPKTGGARVVDSEDDSDMEATGMEMEREEAKAARLARLEDGEEERRLAERAREKKRRRLEMEKKAGRK